MIEEEQEANPPPSPRTPKAPTGARWVGHLAARSQVPLETPAAARGRGPPRRHDLTTVIACAFYHRTRMLPFIYADMRMAPGGATMGRVSERPRRCRGGRGRGR